VKKINILVTLDANYIVPLKVMLKSLFINTPNKSFDIYIIHSDLSEAQISSLQHYVREHNSNLIPVLIDGSTFDDAPVISHYTKAMYYRLLACELLPNHLDKILYLDPDILVINPIDELYDIDVSRYLFAAASHTRLTPLTKHINKLRLNTYDTNGYYNSGVLLMNLEMQRSRIKSEDIFDYVRKHRNELILPDQDILNSLYGELILPLDDSLYNFDVRKSKTYFIASSGQKDINWVMKNTVILHYCGKQKPWKKGYINRFGVLYKHYQSKVNDTKWGR